jgi:hypothetical protein
VIQPFEFLEARIHDSGGDSMTRQILRPVDRAETIKVSGIMVADAEWVKRLEAVSGGKVWVEPGAPVPIEDQIAVACGEYCKRFGVPLRNFGFDGSMRSNLVQTMMRILGTEVVAVDPTQAPTERNANAAGVKARELYVNFVTEQWFQFAMVVNAGQFRGGHLCEKGISQVCARIWKMQGSRRIMESKAEYKKANKGNSPDHGDVLVGGCEMAIRRGFSCDAIGTPEKPSGLTAITDYILKAARFRPRGVAKLRTA